MTAPAATLRQLSPQGRMLDLIVGYWVSCGVHAAARLSIADHLAEGPKSAEELAKAAGAHAPSLLRLLRMLAGAGVFRQRADGRWDQTPLSETLRRDAAGSMRGFARMMVDGYSLRAWEGLLESVRTGAAAFDRVHGKRVFEYLAEHPDQAREFGEAMSSLSSVESPAIAEAIDLSGVTRLMDVGGSHGALLAAILRRQPGVNGLVLDRPEVVESARRDAHAGDPELGGRLEFASGDFFESVPAGADACIMKYILHDWEDELCVRLLSNCRRALPASGRLFVCENVILPGNDPSWGKLLDVNMLVGTGGRERTEADFAQLFSAAGFRLTRVVPTAGPLSIVEGSAA